MKQINLMFVEFTMDLGYYMPNATSYDDLGLFWIDLDDNQTLSIGVLDHDIINMTQEEDFNFEIEFEKYLSNEIKFSMSEKVIMFLEWVLLEPLANGMIFGLVQYEMFGADPMKRRLIDQVSVILKNVKPKKT